MGEDADLNLVSPCGLYCPDCRFHQNRCAGCGYAKGKPFHGECRFYTCVREKGVEHCGLCGEFPCDYYLNTFDPSEARWMVFYRAGQLVYRRRIGTMAWLQQKRRGENPYPETKPS